MSKEQATTDKSTEPVSNVSAIGGSTSIVVGWQAPDVRDYAGVTITATEKDSTRCSNKHTSKLSLCIKYKSRHTDNMDSPDTIKANNKDIKEYSISIQ